MATAFMADKEIAVALPLAVIEGYCVGVVLALKIDFEGSKLDPFSFLCIHFGFLILSSISDHFKGRDIARIQCTRTERRRRHGDVEEDA